MRVKKYSTHNVAVACTIKTTAICDFVYWVALLFQEAIARL